MTRKAEEALKLAQTCEKAISAMQKKLDTTNQKLTATERKLDTAQKALDAMTKDAATREKALKKLISDVEASAYKYTTTVQTQVNANIKAAETRMTKLHNDQGKRFTDLHNTQDQKMVTEINKVYKWVDKSFEKKGA